MLTVSQPHTTAGHPISPALTTGAAPRVPNDSQIDTKARSVIQSASQGLEVSEECQSLAADVLARLWAASVRDQLVRPDDQALTPQVFPLPSGGIQFEWHAGGDHIEVAIEWDGTIGLYAKVGANERDWEIGAREELPFFVRDALSRISDSVWAAEPRI